MAVMLTNPLQVKDSRWLTLEVCREFTRNKCTRSETECKFAHPPPHVEVQNGRVTCCFDSIKGKCQRKDPPCKYLHPPQHLREQLLQNGRNNLILKNLQMQALASSQIPQMVPLPPDKYRLNYGPNYQDHQGQVLQPNPYLMQGPSAVYNPYQTVPPQMASVITNLDATGAPQQVPGMMQQGTGSQQKMQRADRLEVCREFQRGTCSRQPSECRFAHPTDNVTVDSTDNHVTVCMDYVKGKCSRESCRYFHPPPHLQAQIKAVQQRANNAAAQAQAQALGMSNLPAMVPMVKRPAVADSKSGIPMYQPGTGTTAYQQAALAAMQLQQPFVPVTIAGHPPSVPRF